MKKGIFLLLGVLMSGTLAAQSAATDAARSGSVAPATETTEAFRIDSDETTAEAPQFPRTEPNPQAPQSARTYAPSVQGATTARTASPSPQTAAVMAKPVRYLYAELVGNGDFPSPKGDRVILDFGQSTEMWKNNWLKDPKGLNIRFNSMVEALNYMIRQKWEFVQAYTTGAEHDILHYLLRIRVEELPAWIRKQLPTIPDTEPDTTDAPAHP